MGSVVTDIPWPAYQNSFGGDPEDSTGVEVPNVKMFYGSIFSPPFEVTGLDMQVLLGLVNTCEVPAYCGSSMSYTCTTAEDNSVSTSYNISSTIVGAPFAFRLPTTETNTDTLWEESHVSAASCSPPLPESCESGSFSVNCYTGTPPVFDNEVYPLDPDGMSWSPNYRKDIFIHSIKTVSSYSGTEGSGTTESEWEFDLGSTIASWPQSSTQHIKSTTTTNGDSVVIETTSTVIFHVRFLLAGKLYEAAMPLAYEEDTENTTTITSDEDTVSSSYSQDHTYSVRPTPLLNPTQHFNGSSWEVVPGWYPASAVPVDPEDE